MAVVPYSGEVREVPGVIIDTDDVCLFVTEKCNSNCIMCPMSLDSRKRGLSIPQEEWAGLVDRIPDNPSHITITGGEPFLEYRNLLPMMEQINKRFPHTDVLVLSNGRAFSIPELFEELHPLITERYCFAVPIHASNAELHDSISQTQGSFRQSLKGLKNLSQTEAGIEIRIVGHQLNLMDLNHIFHMLVNSGLRINVINLLAMEMMGCAAHNRDSLWVDYPVLCRAAEQGIKYALLHGIDVGLYNFPLCTIPKQMWPLAKQSITPSKVRFYEECRNCREYYACGGMFYSTFALNLCKVRPITGSEKR